MMSEETVAWFAGVDWGSEKHQACLLDAQGSIVGEREFAHSAVGLAELGDWILSIAGAKDDRRDAYVLADGVRTDRRLFRRIHVADHGLLNCVHGRGLSKN